MHGAVRAGPAPAPAPATPQPTSPAAAALHPEPAAIIQQPQPRCPPPIVSPISDRFPTPTNCLRRTFRARRRTARSGTIAPRFQSGGTSSCRKVNNRSSKNNSSNNNNHSSINISSGCQQHHQHQQHQRQHQPQQRPNSSSSSSNNNYDDGYNNIDDDDDGGKRILGAGTRFGWRSTAITCPLHPWPTPSTAPPNEQRRHEMVPAAVQPTQHCITMPLSSTSTHPQPPPAPHHDHGQPIGTHALTIVPLATLILNTTPVFFVTKLRAIELHPTATTHGRGRTGTPAGHLLL